MKYMNNYWFQIRSREKVEKRLKKISSYLDLTVKFGHHFLAVVKLLTVQEHKMRSSVCVLSAACSSTLDVGGHANPLAF